MRPRRRPATSSVLPLSLAAALGAALLLVIPSGALAARLVGGRAQAAIRRAFDTSAAHRKQLIVSIRTSSVDPAWAVVRSVTPPAAGRTTARGADLRLSSAFYRRVGGSERAGSPSAAVRSDLDSPLRVAVVYAGSGSESVSYDQTYRSDCAGQGGMVDSETVTVQPMSWTVRYIVDLDDVLGASRGADGSVIVPAVTFDAHASRLDAVERLTRTVQDVGCNQGPSTFTCTKTFYAGGKDPGGELTLTTANGLDVGVPMSTATSGQCVPSDYTLGPSLWESGGATAIAAHLGLAGGSLPPNPYAPVKVASPGNSGLAAQPFASSPCAGDAVVCRDTFKWKGTVRLEPVG